MQSNSIYMNLIQCEEIYFKTVTHVTRLTNALKNFSHNIGTECCIKYSSWKTKNDVNIDLLKNLSPLFYTSRSWPSYFYYYKILFFAWIMQYQKILQITFGPKETNWILFIKANKFSVAPIIPQLMWNTYTNYEVFQKIQIFS